MASSNKTQQSLKAEASPVIMIVAIVIVVLALGAGGFYAFNGGWKTAGQQDDDYKHNMLPIMAARKGDMEPFNQENELRKKNGQPLLVLPADKDTTQGNAKAGIQAMKQKMGIPQADPSATQ